MGQPAEIHGFTAFIAADGKGYVLFLRFDFHFVPQPQRAKPPAVITVAIGAWRAVVLADRQKHLAAGLTQLLGNLGAGRTRTDHQHRTGRQLLWILVRR